MIYSPLYDPTYCSVCAARGVYPSLPSRPDPIVRPYPPSRLFPHTASLGTGYSTLSLGLRSRLESIISFLHYGILSQRALHSMRIHHTTSATADDAVSRVCLNMIQSRDDISGSLYRYSSCSSFSVAIENGRGPPLSIDVESLPESSSSSQTQLQRIIEEKHAREFAIRTGNTALFAFKSTTLVYPQAGAATETSLPRVSPEDLKFVLMYDPTCYHHSPDHIIQKIVRVGDIDRQLYFVGRINRTVAVGPLTVDGLGGAVNVEFDVPNYEKVLFHLVKKGYLTYPFYTHITRTRRAP